MPISVPAPTGITGPALAALLHVLTADSLRARATPSPGLEAAGRYVAQQFEALGLTPLSGNRTWFQRYVLPAQLDFARSRLVFTVNGREAATDFATAAWLANRQIAAPDTAPVRVPVLLLAGRQSMAARAPLDVRAKVVLYVPPAHVDPELEAQIVRQLSGASRGVVVAELDSAAAMAKRHAAGQESGVRLGTSWSGYVWPDGVAGLRALLATQSIDLARLQKDTTAVVRDLPALQITLVPRFTRAQDYTTTAANVVGVLEGNDPLLKADYVVFMAHLDNGRVPNGGTPNGRVLSDGLTSDRVHDNAVGVAGLLALAQAFSQPGARPARSVAFMATSGGTEDLWGSRAFAMQLDGGNLTDPRMEGGVIPIDDIITDQIVAAFNLDRIDGPATALTDSAVVVDGLKDVALPTPLSWLLAAHPELGLTVVDGGTAAVPTSDQFPFVQQGVPSLWFHIGQLGAGQPGVLTSGDLTTSVLERTAKLVRLAYYVGQDVANAPASPRSTAEGRQHYLDTFHP